jgi:hypothetical protein
LKELRTEIEINTSPERVWKILTDFDKYEQWNPFIHKIIGQPKEGQPKEGTKIEIHIETSGGKNRKYSPTLTRVDEEHELRWLGKSSFPGFLNGEHIFTIEQLESQRVRFVQRELFEGLLTSLFGKSLDKDVRHGLEEMNRALKERAERTAI